ncbi:MAG: CAAX protease [Pseudomonadota bacterium]
MPQTVAYRPLLIDNLITNERLNSYKTTFKTSTDVELVGAYLWNINVCSEIYHLISAAEITLRNAIDKALTADLGYFWWKKSKLHYKSFAPGQVPPFFVKCVYDNFDSASRAVIKEKKDRYGITGNVKPSHHEIIAKTEFSTWEFILDHEFMGNNLIWPRNMGKVFLGNWPSLSANTTLTYMRDLVKTIREFRNRIFHHEPAWKKFGVQNESDAIVHLHEKIAKIIELINTTAPEKKNLLDKNKIIQNAYRSCSISEIRRFQHKSAVTQVKTIAKFRTLIDRATGTDSIEKMVVYSDKKRTLLIQPY